MKISRIDSGVTRLLSTIARQELTPEDSFPTLVFLGALVTLLLGVIDADGKASEAEQKRLSEILDLFISPQTNLRQIAQQMCAIVQEHCIHNHLDSLQTLVAPLDESERILLMGFGYDMSAVDRNMDAREIKYLRNVAHCIGIKPEYQEVLEAGFSERGNYDGGALAEVRFLLAPTRFYLLDPVFVSAAKEMLALLPVKSDPLKFKKEKSFEHYQQLQAFQRERRQLLGICDRLFHVAREGRDRQLLPAKFRDEIGEFSQKFRTRQFRLAVVGEFSQGKSTLLNALLQERLLPVRAIPCTSTLTVLRHGSGKKTTCTYRDGRLEEIPFEKYREKMMISKEMATGNCREELFDTELQEITIEHPDLSLCRNGVEIVDSPGLNEHPAYAEITNQLIANSDAVIFVTSAHRPLTEFEFHLLQDIKSQLNRLNGVDENEPAHNLFVVVNFMDLLKTEEDRQDVRSRIENHVLGKNPVVKNEDRIHFISAEKTIDSLEKQYETEYSLSFKQFTQSIERFLIFERSYLEFQKITYWLEKEIKKVFYELSQIDNFISGKLDIAQRERQQLLSQIVEATKYANTIREMVEPMSDEAFEEAKKSWQDWKAGIEATIQTKSEKWHGKHSPVWNKEKLVKHYFNQFLQELKKELDNWEKNRLVGAILAPKLNELDKKIEQELTSLQQNLSLLDGQINTSFSQQFDLELEGINIAGTIPGNWLQRLGTGAGIVSGGVLLSAEIIPQILSLGLSSRMIISAITFGLGPIVVGAIAGMLADLLLLPLKDRAIKNKTKKKLINLGFQVFEEHQEKYIKQLQEFIHFSFSRRVKLAETAIAQFTSSADNLLKLYDPKMLKQPQAEKAWIDEKYRDLQKLQQAIARYREFYPIDTAVMTKQSPL